MGLIRFSKRTVARKAVAYAIANRDAFAAKLAAKLDIPVLDEAEEKEAFLLVIDAALIGLGEVLDGQGLPVEIGISKRQLVDSAVDLARDNLHEFLGTVLGDLGWRGTLRTFAEPLMDRAMAELDEWVAQTPLLD